MDWENKGEESRNLKDRRRMGPRSAALGTVGTLIVLAVAYFLGVSPQQLSQLLSNSQLSQGGSGQVASGPVTAEEERSRKFAATILGFTEKVWGQKFQEMGRQYTPPRMVLFTDRVDTGCGMAPSAVGPFYCPEDQVVYLDPTFFNELQQSLGGSKGEFSQAYVIAHEVGHHVQNLLGYSRIVDQKRQTLPAAEFNKWSVRLELQADYLAGVWAHYGQEEFHFIEPGDVESAIQSANAIGDDRLQKRAGGFVSPEKFTHGTSAQRVKWFSTGLKTGDMSLLKSIFETPYERL